MPRSMNVVYLLGHLGRDADTKFTQSGIACTKFSLATSRRFKNGQTGEWTEETDWHNIVCWRMEKVAEYLKKGKAVLITVRIQTRSYEKDGQKHYATEIVAEDLILLGDRGAPAAFAGSAPTMPSRPAQSAQDVVDDPEIPF